MDLEKIVSVASFVRMPEGWGLPCLFEGPPGVGKSARTKSSALSRGLDYRVVYVPTKQPEDLSGLPVPGKNGQVTFACGLDAVTELNAREGGVLLLDEVNWAPRAVQVALLSLVLERQVGSTRLHPNIRIFLAANAVEEGDGGHSMLTTLGNRMAHFRIDVPTVDEYLAFRQGAVSVERGDVHAIEERVTKGWPSAYARMNGLHCSFIRALPNRIHQQPPAGSKDRGKAWPSPRSWDAAIRTAATCALLGESAAIFEFMAAIVGTGAAAEYAEYVAKHDMPDPRTMLVDGWRPRTDRPDVSIGAYTTMTDFVVQQPLAAERQRLAAYAWERLREACEAGLTDVAFPLARTLMQKNLAWKCADRNVARAATVVLKRLEASGVLPEYAS